MKKSFSASICRPMGLAIGIFAVISASPGFSEEGAETFNQSVPSATQRDHNINQPSPFGDDPVERDRESASTLNDEQGVQAKEDMRETDRARRGMVSSQSEGPSIVYISTGNNQLGSVAVETLIDRKVVNWERKELGEVASVVKPESGEVAALVIGVGGFMGIGEREIVVPLDEFRLVGRDLIWETDMNKSQVKKSDDYYYQEDRYSKVVDD